MNQFKVKKAGKYFDLIYIGHIAPNFTFDLHIQKNLYFSNRKEIEVFTKYVKDLEAIIPKYTKFEPSLIIRNYLKFIDGVSSGLDIRSSWSIDKVAEQICIGYQNLYQEAVDFNKKLEDLVETEKIHYYKEYRKFEKHSRNLLIFLIDGTEFKTDDIRLGKNPLETMLEKAEGILRDLKKSTTN